MQAQLYKMEQQAAVKRAAGQSLSKPRRVAPVALGASNVGVAMRNQQDLKDALVTPPPPPPPGGNAGVSDSYPVLSIMSCERRSKCEVSLLKRDQGALVLLYWSSFLENCNQSSISYYKGLSLWLARRFLWS